MSQRIPQEVIEEIRRQSNIVDVVGQYVQLKKSGKNYFGLCPFHEERSPSFSVAEDKQMYHCFGCGKGGNVFKFLQEVDGLSFPESVKKVADMEGVQLNYDFASTASAEPSEHQRQQNELIKLHEKAAEIFHHVLLNTQAGEQALSYLKGRGLTEEIIAEFQIGFAPRERILLKKIFENEEVSDELLDASGLMTQRDNGEWLDRFYQRIMFPIRNAQGKIIAFSGRILQTENFDSDKMPKYLNSPETLIFNKRQTLFNYDQAKNEARKEQELTLFEGFMDVIAAWTAGVKNGVASMGTSLTNEQIKMIQRVSNKLLLCYDGDSAGIEATKRALDLLSSETTLELSVARLPDGLDPDDYIGKYGAEEFVRLTKSGRETEFTFKMSYFKRGKNLKNEQERFGYLQEMVKELVKVPSVIEREVYINQIAEEFDISVEAITEEIRGAQQDGHREKRENRQKRQAPEFNHYEPPMDDLEPYYDEPMPTVEQRAPKEYQVKPMTYGEKAEQMLLFRIMHERAVQAKINQVSEFAFIHDEYQELYSHFNDYMLTQGSFVEADFLSYLQEDYLKEKFVTISYIEMSEESSVKEIDDYLLALKRYRLESVKQQKIIAQKEASRTGNKQLEQELTVEIINIQRQLKSV
ncbi:DNA primase [Vagococcus sp. BWB3-3]|uniref:DNA primase n=1 Tax=Vagococcus allomyrinae TaxID=2794353 RepID=A0A940PFW8_9ENTE|nr:DNA primase [Vagococcus allomyrinae]MBP1044125.1 DNA primase [Vagococcus allomyrinae]